MWWVDPYDYEELDVLERLIVDWFRKTEAALMEELWGMYGDNEG